MKKGIFGVGLLIVLLISLSNYLHIRSIENMLHKAETTAAASVRANDQEDIELGDVMTKLQRHSNKLWFSGREANWPLAAFYIHELEETFELLTEGEIIDEGVDISSLALSMGLGPLAVVEEAVKQRDSAAFLSSFENLTSNCNVCHRSSNHPFVVITKPTSPIFDNQEYKVVN